MGKDCEQLFYLLEDIYETVNDNTHWQAVLSYLASYVFNGKAVITSRDNKTGLVDGLDLAVTKILGINEDYVSAYINEVSKYDVWIPIELNHKYEQDPLCVFSDYLPIRNLKKTDFYTNWLQPLGIADGIAVQLFKTKHFRIVLNVFYEDNSESVQQLHKDIRRITPHLCNAIALWMQTNREYEIPELQLRTKFLRKKHKVTKRELEIVSAYFRIGNAKKVAKIFGINDGTVRDHVKNVKRKMKCNSTHELMLKLFAYSNEDSVNSIIP